MWICVVVIKMNEHLQCKMGKEEAKDKPLSAIGRWLVALCQMKIDMNLSLFHFKPKLSLIMPFCSSALKQHSILNTRYCLGLGVE